MRLVAFGLAVAGVLLTADGASATFPPYRGGYNRGYYPPYGRGGYLPSPYPYIPPYRPIYPPYIPPVTPVRPVYPVVPVNPVYPPYIPPLYPPYIPPYGPLYGGSSGATRVPPPAAPATGTNRLPPPRPAAGLPAGLGVTVPR